MEIFSLRLEVSQFHLNNKFRSIDTIYLIFKPANIFDFNLKILGSNFDSNQIYTIDLQKYEAKNILLKKIYKYSIQQTAKEERVW